MNYKYVVRKTKQVLLPFLYKEPELTEEDDFDENNFNIAKSRIEYPDMYLPLMGFMSYLMLITFYYAISNGDEFQPENLYSKCSKNFFLALIHMGILKAGKRILF